MQVEFAPDENTYFFTFHSIVCPYGYIKKYVLYTGWSTEEAEREEVLHYKFRAESVKCGLIVLQCYIISGVKKKKRGLQHNTK